MLGFAVVGAIIVVVAVAVVIIIVVAVVVIVVVVIVSLSCIRRVNRPQFGHDAPNQSGKFWELEQSIGV